MSMNFKAVGMRIREARKIKRFSQADLAEYVEVSVNYISLIETAKKRVSLEVLVATANALEVTVDSLLSGNLASDASVRNADILKLIEDCDNYERLMIYDVAAATKKSLRSNEWVHQKNANL